MKEITVSISEKIQKDCPDLRVAYIRAMVRNTVTSEKLWQEIQKVCQNVIDRYDLKGVNKRPAISATREAYKSLGKEPSRYRPSAEALCRRILRGLPLYQVSTLVDLINVVSIKSGYSIGGFDLELIQGNLTLGVGTSNEDFEAIGRGQLNIEFMPVYRDEAGGVGTPTSDHERTKIRANTRQLLMIFNGYSGEEGLPEAVEYALDLLKKYAEMTDYAVTFIK